MFNGKIHYFYGGFPLFHVTYLHPWKTSGASKAKSCRETDNQAWKMTCDSWQSHGGQTRNHSVGFREIFWLVVWYTYPSEKSWSEFVSWDDNPN